MAAEHMGIVRIERCRSIGCGCRRMIAIFEYDLDQVEWLATELPNHDQATKEIWDVAKDLRRHHQEVTTKDPE